MRNPRATCDNVNFPPLPSQAAKSSVEQRAILLALSKRTKVVKPLTTIESLPDELLLLILAYLFADIDSGASRLKQLNTLSQTSRSLHRLVAEELYASFDGQYGNAYLFLRTIISTPQLADLVKHVRVADDYSRTCYSATARDKKIIKDGLRTAEIPDWKFWATRCNSVLADIDDFCSVIMMFTKNVASLDVAIDTDLTDLRSAKLVWLATVKNMAIGSSQSKLHRFERLSHASLLLGCMELKNLVPIFRLPHLRSLQLCSLQAAYYEEGRQGPESLRRLLPPKCNNLKKLSLESSFVRPDYLGVLVASAESLQEFAYTVSSFNGDIDWYIEGNDGYSDIVYGVTLSELLQCQAQTLQVLQISGEVNVVSCYKRADPRHELRNLKVLSHLMLPLEILNQLMRSQDEDIEDFWPPPVRSVTFWSDAICRRSGHVQSLKNFASFCSRSISQLQVVEIKLTTSYSDHTLEDILIYDDIIDAFEVSGVKVYIDNYQRRPGRMTHEKSPIFTQSSSSESSDEVSLYSHNSE